MDYPVIVVRQRRRPNSAYRVVIPAVAMSLVLLIGFVAHVAADDTGAVSITVSTEAVGVTITGGALNFGGPHAPDTYVWAHPSSGVVGTTPPTVTNSGNVAFSYLGVTFDGVTGQEATCDGGASHWSAHASTNAQDRFVLRTWASTNTNTSNFVSLSSAVAPSTGSGNVLSATLDPDAFIPLLFRLHMPDPTVAGGEGCTIGLTVTVAAE